MPHFTMKIHCVKNLADYVCPHSQPVSFTLNMLHAHVIAVIGPQVRHIEPHTDSIEWLNWFKMKLNNGQIVSFQSACAIFAHSVPTLILELGSFSICWLALNWLLVIIRLPKRTPWVCSTKSGFICSLIAIIRMIVYQLLCLSLFNFIRVWDCHTFTYSIQVSGAKSKSHRFTNKQTYPSITQNIRIPFACFSGKIISTWHAADSINNAAKSKISKRTQMHITDTICRSKYTRSLPRAFEDLIGTISRTRGWGRISEHGCNFA